MDKRYDVDIVALADSDEAAGTRVGAAIAREKSRALSLGRPEVFERRQERQEAYGFEGQPGDGDAHVSDLRQGRLTFHGNAAGPGSTPFMFER